MTPMPHQLNATGFLQKGQVILTGYNKVGVVRSKCGRVKWRYGGEGVYWSELWTLHVFGGGGGGGGRERKGREKREKRREIGVCELHLSLSRVSPNKSYTTVVYDKGGSGWLTSQSHSVKCCNNAHDTWHIRQVNMQVAFAAHVAKGCWWQGKHEASCSQLRILYAFATAA